MQSIELTQEHRDKLMEMCKILFPEFNVTLEIKPQYDGSDRFVCFKDLSLSTVGEYIHWFEFCITHLQAKLYDEITKISNIGIDKWNHKLIGRVYFHVFRSSVKQGHPIDFLYDEFKKLK